MVSSPTRSTPIHLVKNPTPLQCGVRNSEFGANGPRRPLSRSALRAPQSALRWWSRWDSNPRPPGCKPGALPAELRPPGRHLRFWIFDFRFRAGGEWPWAVAVQSKIPKSEIENAVLVGPGGFEPPTSPLSGARSSRLSYEPLFNCGPRTADFGLKSPTARDRRGQSAIRNPQFAIGTVRADVERECADEAFAPKGEGPGVLPRKEVIQPQVPLRLPCYDLVPVTRLTVGASPPCGLGQRLRVLPASVA